MKANGTFKRKKLVDLAIKILKGEVSLLQGSVLIDNSIDTSKDEDNFMLPIKGIVSQAGDMVQEKYKIDEFEFIDLTKYEKELDQYFIEEKLLIFEICREIIKKSQ